MPPLFLAEHNRTGEVGATIPQIDGDPLRRSKALVEPGRQERATCGGLIPYGTPGNIV